MFSGGMKAYRVHFIDKQDKNRRNEITMKRLFMMLLTGLILALIVSFVVACDSEEVGGTDDGRIDNIFTPENNNDNADDRAALDDRDGTRDRKDTNDRTDNDSLDDRGGTRDPNNRDSEASS